MKTSIGKINIENIRTGKYIIRTEKENKEDIENLAESIKYDGLLHPIGVTKLDDDHYELIYGDRRLKASMLLNEKEIDAKIYEEMDDIEAIEKCIIENYHRKDLSPNDKDKSIYYAWKIGKESGKYKSIYDMSKKVSISESTLRRIIYASEEKEKIENINDNIIQNATTRDLDRTKTITAFPNIRKKLLKLNQEKKIQALDLDSISDTIKAADIREEIVKKAIELAAEEKKIDPEKFDRLIDVIKKSPEDIQEKIINKKITIDEAIKINKYGFATKEEREQIIAESQKFDELNKKSVERHIAVRQKQADTIKEGKDPLVLGIKTGIDRDRENKLERNEPNHYDETYINEYAKLYSDILRIFGIFSISKMRTEEGKVRVKEYIKDIRNRCNKILLSDPDSITVVSERW